MSAILIRNLVASKLNCDPCNVILSGEINPEYTGSIKRHTSFVCSWEEETNLYGWFPTEFKKITECINSYITNGHSQDDQVYTAIPLYKVEGVSDAILFVEEYASYQDNEWITEYRVYKSADFKAKIEQITVKDIARWENWLNHE